MARTDQPDLGLAGPGHLLPPPVAGRHRLSTGHVVMIVSGLLATLLTYSVLRQAGGGQGAEVLVASDAIRPGQTADPSLFSTARVRASSAALKGIVTPGGEATIMGRVAVVDISRGQLISGQQFQAATPPSPGMALVVDPQTVPGGVPALTPGSRIDVIAATQAGAPLVVEGLTVLRTLDPPGKGLGASSTVQIEVAVPDLATAGRIRDATASGKFAIRVIGSPAGAGPPG